MGSEDHTSRLQPFSEFYTELKGAGHEAYRSKPGVRVRSIDAFCEQKAHLLALYDGVRVDHSFVDSGGQIFDCMPAEQQPALRRSGGKLASPPKVPSPASARAASAVVPAPLHAAKKDRHGNEMMCPPGTVPVRRLTLDELVRYETLDHFLRKHAHPRGRVRAHRRVLLRPETQETPHEYAHASQGAANIGGHSILNVWSPTIGQDQIFSLSQHWYVADSAAGVQTIEVGWQVCPQMYGHSNPVLFTYWTADGYQKTGSYSLTGGHFVQYSATHPVGMALTESSQLGGDQVELELTVMLEDGNWWLFVNGTDAAHAVGYYPATLYAGGPLATGATEIDYGGETVGNGSYPPMGSGEFAAKGYKFAAYQRNIYYFQSSSSAVEAALTPSQDWPQSYTIRVDRSNDWGEHFYFGGPGTAFAGPLSSSGVCDESSGRLVMEGPLGVRIEGLSIRDAAALIRNLGRQT